MSEICRLEILFPYPSEHENTPLNTTGAYVPGD